MKRLYELLKNGKVQLAIALIAFLALYAAYWPPFWHSNDDQVHIRTAWRLLHGYGYNIDDPLYTYSSQEYYNEFLGNWYYPFNPLTPLLLMPFVAAGFQFVWLTPLLAHVACFLLFALILQELGQPANRAVLYLFFPAMQYYNRTVLGDMLILPFFFASVLFYLKKKDLYAGIMLGIGLLIRDEAALLAGAYFFVRLLEKDWRGVANIAVPFALAAAILFAGFNFPQYGMLLNPDRQVRLEGGNIDFETTIYNAAAYVGTLISGMDLTHQGDVQYFFPFLMVSLFLYRGRLWKEIVVFSGAMIVFHAVVVQAGFVKHMVPVAALMLIPLSAMLKNRKMFVMAVIIMMSVSAYAISIYQNWALIHSDLSEVLYANTEECDLIVGDYGVSKLMYEGFGNRKFSYVDMEYPGNVCYVKYNQETKNGITYKNLVKGTI